MDGKVIVAYASKYGATAEIAKRIGTVLSQAGLASEVLPVERVADLREYRAVVLGSALYIGKWQKAAEVFLKNNEQALAERPVWLFSSGPTGEGDPVELVEGQCLPAALQPIVVRLQPRDTTVFHGFINPDKINFIEKLAIKNVVKKPFGDFRNWYIIDSWAEKIAMSLKHAEG